MREYHSLLRRQIKKAGLNPDEPQGEELEKFLELVNEEYFDFEDEKQLLERSIEISSREYQESIEAIRCLQIQLVHNEKMAGIGQLSAGIAHEINNPLGFIQSNMDMLNKYLIRIISFYQRNKAMMSDAQNCDLETLQEQCRKEQQYIRENKLDFIFENLSGILTETSDGLIRISKIVNSLLGFSRQCREGEFVKYDMNKGIRATLTIANNEIKYHAAVEENLEEIPLINVCSGEINQVILNLIVNAAYAIKSKGTQGIIRVHTYSDSDYVYCEIADNGIGIPQEIQTKIFEPFFTTKPVGAGTGLGLSISYNIVVSKHHGEIMVESTPGEGTVFIIKLPIVQSAEHNS